MSYSPMELKVREATNNDPWGASSTLMDEIARGTEDYEEYSKLFSMVWKRVTDKEHHMHVKKALLLIEYLLRHGADRFVVDARRREFDIKRLQKYSRYVEGEDVAYDIRSKAKAVHALLTDDIELAKARSQAEGTKNIRKTAISNDDFAYQGQGFVGGHRINKLNTKTSSSSRPKKPVGPSPRKAKKEKDPFGSADEPDPFAAASPREKEKKKKKKAPKKAEEVDPFDAAQATPTNKDKKKKKKDKKKEKGPRRPSGGGDDFNPRSASSQYAAQAGEVDMFDAEAVAEYAVRPKPQKKRQVSDVDLLGSSIVSPQQPRGNTGNWVDAVIDSHGNGGSDDMFDPRQQQQQQQGHQQQQQQQQEQDLFGGSAFQQEEQQQHEDTHQSKPADAWDLVGSLSNLEDLTQTKKVEEKKVVGQCGPSMTQLRATLPMSGTLAVGDALGFQQQPVPQQANNAYGLTMQAQMMPQVQPQGGMYGGAHNGMGMNSGMYGQPQGYGMYGQPQHGMMNGGMYNQGMQGGMMNGGGMRTMNGGGMNGMSQQMGNMNLNGGVRPTAGDPFANL